MIVNEGKAFVIGKESEGARADIVRDTNAEACGVALAEEELADVFLNLHASAERLRFPGKIAASLGVPRGNFGSFILSEDMVDNYVEVVSNFRTAVFPIGVHRGGRAGVKYLLVFT